MKLTLSSYKIEKFFLFITIFAGFWGPAFFSVDLGVFTLFPYRFFLILTLLLFISRILAQSKFSLPFFRIKNYLLFYFIWLIYAVLTLAWAKDRVAAVEDIVFLAIGVLVIFFTVYYSGEEGDFERLYWLWIIIFFGFILLGFWEHLTGNHLQVSKLYQSTDPRVMNVPTGAFHNQNDYAMMLTLSIPFANALIRYKKRLLARLFGLVLVLSAFYLIVITGSRTNILAVVLEFGFLWLVLLGAKTKVRYGVAVLLLVVVLLFIAPDLMGSFYTRLSYNLNSLVAQVKSWSDSMMVRLNLVRNGILFFRSTGGLGVGAGNAEFWMSNFGRYYTKGVVNPHNWWLEILINYGFISFGYFMIYISLIWNLWKNWRGTKILKRKMISEVLLLSLVGFFGAGLSPSSIMAYKPHWFIFAFALAFLNYHRKGQIT